MRKIVILLFVNLVMLVGCKFTSENIELRIYETFFNDMSLIVITKQEAADIYRVDIEGDDLEIIKNELTNISSLQEYKADASPFGGFKEGFRSLIIYNEKQRRDLRLLYSVNESAMIVRKCDIFPQEGIDLPLIVVYEFKIPEKVVSILEKHERKLPETGYFFTSWPFDY